MSSLQIALFNTSTITHKEFASISSLQIALFESVYVSVLCVCVNKFLLPFFCSLLNACHPPSPLLFSVPLVSIRLTRLWTILCPVSMVLGQPALRAARKVMFTCFNARAALICTTASCICLPLCHSRCSCLFIQRLALRLSWTEKQSRSGRISMHPAGLLGRCVFGGAGLTVFSCGKHKHTVVQSVLVVQTHTNRLSHFSFFLPANFLHLLFFLPANFLHFSFFLPANFLHLLFSLSC